MNGWTLTRVWRIDHMLVVAKTVEDAVALFKTYMGPEYNGEPSNIEAVPAAGIGKNYNAIIKDE